MILQCKNCNARYLVPDVSIGAEGRTVRCAKCAHSWFESAPASIIEVKKEEALPDFDQIIGDINATPKPIAAGSNLPAPRVTTPAGLKAMVALFAIIAIGLALFATMPALFGTTPSKGLALADIDIHKRTDESGTIVEITGNILNTSESPHPVPNIRVMLLDSQNNPLQSWEFNSNGETLQSKASMPFTTGQLNVKFSIAKRFVVDLGTPVELAMRRRP